MSCLTNVTVGGVDGIGTYAFTWTFLNDPWIVPHVIAPFWIGMLARRPSWAVLVAVAWELIEIVFYSAFGSFVLFAEANNVTESTAAIAEDIFQGVLAAIVVQVFIWAFPGPRYLSSRSSWSTILYYWLMYSLMIAPATFYALKVGNFAIGVFIYPFITGLFLLMFEFTPCRPKVRWSRRYTNRVEYWLTPYAWCLIICVQNTWCYLQSNGVQSWIYTGLFILYMIGRKLTVDGRRKNIIEL